MKLPRLGKKKSKAISGRHLRTTPAVAGQSTLTTAVTEAPRPVDVSWSKDSTGYYEELWSASTADDPVFDKAMSSFLELEDKAHRAERWLTS